MGTRIQQPDFAKLKLEVRQFLLSLSLFDFIDPSKPWILVENGNFMGFFEFVPPVFREGPWAVYPMTFIAGAIYYVLMSGVYHYSTQGIQDLPRDYYGAFTAPWYLNLAGLLWTLYVFRDLFVSGPGAGSVATFTVQSYSLILLRFFLSAIAPFIPGVAVLNELLRYPTLSQATITFVVWNMILAPTVCLCIKNQQQRKSFFKYITSFRLMQLHFFNIFLAIFSGVWGTPGRPFLWTDKHMAMALGLQYCLFYVMILDRLGIHLYLIFSPRTNICIVALSLVIASTLGLFPLWDRLIATYGGQWDLSISKGASHMWLWIEPHAIVDAA